MAANSSASFTFKADIPTKAPSSITNTANVTAIQAGGNEQVSASSSLTTTITPIFTVTKTGPSQVNVGSLLTYNINITNPSSTPITVSFSDPLPADGFFQFRQFRQTSGPTFSINRPPANSTTGTITGTGTLAAGQTATFTLIVRVLGNAPETVSNTITVTSTNPPLTRSSAVTTQVIRPDVQNNTVVFNTQGSNNTNQIVRMISNGERLTRVVSILIRNGTVINRKVCKL